MVRKAWNFVGVGSPAFALCQRLKATNWNRAEFGSIQTNIRNLQLELDRVQQAVRKLAGDSRVLAREREVSGKLIAEQRKEEDLRC